MRCRHTRQIRLCDGSMELAFPGYRITVEFGGGCPRPAGAWVPASIFCVDDAYNLLLLAQNGNLAFWLLDADLRLQCNDAATMLSSLRGLSGSNGSTLYDPSFLAEVQGLLLHHTGQHHAAFDAFAAACEAGELRDGESYSALIGSAAPVGRVSDALAWIEPILDRADFLSPEQAAVPKAWMGRVCADRGDYARGHRLLADAVAGSAKLGEWVPGYLDHCSRNDKIHEFSEPTDLLRREMAAFEQGALDFLARRPVTWRPGRYPTITVARHWVRWNLTVIHLEPDDADSVALLQAGGLSPTFLQPLLRGRDGVGEACYALSPDIPFAADPSISLRVKDLAATVLLGGKPVLCPFTGERDLARDTINLHTFLHRKNGRSCIIFSDPDISLAPADSAWFFPDLGVVLTVGWNMRPEIDLATTMQRVMDNREAVEFYLAAPERAIMVSEEGMGHIGHYIWNVISGWTHLFGLIEPSDIKILTSYDGGHFFGGVTELYKDELRSAGQVLRLPRREDAFITMLTQRGLSLILRDRHVSQDVAERVQTWCRQQVPDAFLKTRDSLRKATDPLLMITLRLENRAWVDQENGYINIIRSLAAEYPRLGVIIDGLNALPPGTQTYAKMSVTDEQAMAERIMAACPAVRFVNAIGCTPAESVLWCASVDAFLAPIGAGLAKSRWIANKPGVGFSNRTFLEDGHFEGYLYSHFREAPSPMLYVGREHVSDVDGGHHGLVGRANFNMDWREPLAVLRTLLACQRIGPAQQSTPHANQPSSRPHALGAVG